MPRVFAYGSNMCLPDLARWLGARGHAGRERLRTYAAVLPSHRLVWNYFSPPREGGAANIEPCDGRDLPGVVVEVDAVLLAAIDDKEGHPTRYLRARRTVRLLDDTAVEAWVYVVTPAFVKPYPVLPRRAYLELLLDGARAHGLPDWHIAELLATPVADE